MVTVIFAKNSFQCSSLGLVQLDQGIGDGAPQHGFKLGKHTEVIRTSESSPLPKGQKSQSMKRDYFLYKKHKINPIMTTW